MDRKWQKTDNKWLNTVEIEPKITVDFNSAICSHCVRSMQSDLCLKLQG